MEEFFTRILENMGYRVTGPMHFRIYLQPLVAAVLGVISGMKDVKCGWSPYFRTLVRDPVHRREMITDGWQSVAKVFIVAMILDIIYQLIVAQWIFPLEVLIAGLLLAIVPYIIVRGLVGRSISLITGRKGVESYAKDPPNRAPLEKTK